MLKVVVIAEMCQTLSLREILPLVWLIYYIGSLLYNIYLHPLRHYPGPKFHAASRIPITYSIIKGTSTYHLKALHDKYGPVVRVAPHELSYADSKAWKDIHASMPTRRGGMERDVGFLKPTEDEGLPPTILTADDVNHARIRRAYAPAFSKQSLIAKEAEIIRHVDHLILKFHKLAGEPTDVVDLFTFTLFDIQVDLQIGESLQLLDQADSTAWVNSQRGWTRASISAAAITDFPWIKAILIYLTPKFVRAQRELFFKYSRGKMDNRFSAKDERNDITNRVANHGGKALSEIEIRANAPLLIIAGNETTSTLLSSLTYYLLTHPKVFHKVIQEVRSTFSDGTKIEMASMGHLDYLNACMKETLRVFPALPTPIPRVVPQDGAMISGQWVPGGTRVYMAPYATYRSARNFSYPDEFIPDRWLEDPEGKYAADDQAAHRPFALGPRDCIGQDMAYYLARLIMCKLIMNFDLKLCPESEGWSEDQRIWIVWDKPALLVKMMPRERENGAVPAESRLS